MKKFSVLVICICMIMLSCACSSTTEGTSKTENIKNDSLSVPETEAEAAGIGKIKDTIVLVNEKEPDTLDPRRGNGVSNNIVMNLIYDSLIRLDKDGKPQPRLAESWELIDNTHLKVKLREDVVFSNGSKFNADDVLFCLERTLHDPTSQSTMAWYDPDKSTKEDDYNLTIAMKYPYAPIFWVLSGWRCWMGDKETMEEMGEDAYSRAPIGTGPYKLKNWVVGSELDFERNDSYWGETPKTKNITLRIVPEPANRVIELETGAADFAYYIAGTDKDRVESLPNAHVESGISEKYYLITFNMQHKLLSNQHIRNALTFAIDVPQLTAAAFDNQAKAMTGMYPSIFPYFKDMDGGFKYDVEKAKEELKEAGYPDGFEIELHILPGADYQRMAEIVQAYWSEIGVKAHIEQSELGTREAQGPWEASIRTATANEISNVLIIYEKAFASRINSNDDVLEKMLQDLKMEYDDSSRKVLLEKIQDYLFEKKYSIPFAETDTIYGISDKIHNFKFTNNIAELNIPEWVVGE